MRQREIQLLRDDPPAVEWRVRDALQHRVHLADERVDHAGLDLNRFAGIQSLHFHLVGGGAVGGVQLATSLFDKEEFVTGVVVVAQARVRPGNLDLVQAADLATGKVEYRLGDAAAVVLVDELQPVRSNALHDSPKM